MTTRIAISGHRGLTPDVETIVDHALRGELAARAGDGLVGFSCLADSSDQLFARAILDLGGTLEVIIPATKYRDALPKSCHAAYDDLLAHASAVHRLHHVESTSIAHQEASEEMLRRADLLFAVWDGRPARAHGGTADAVDVARATGLPVIVVWPEGAYRR